MVFTVDNIHIIVNMYDHKYSFIDKIIVASNTVSIRQFGIC